MIKRFVIITLGTIFSLQSSQLKNPDANTLWLEDGKDIKTSSKSEFYRWRSMGLEIQSASSGKGVSFCARDGKHRKALTGIKFSPEYPYLIFRISNLEMLRGYRNWTLSINGWFSSVQAATPQKGIYVYDLFQNLPEKETSNLNRYLTFYLYNLKMELEYLKIVKNPPYSVKVECADSEIKPGSKVKLTAYLEKEAEDVSITLITNGVPKSIKINGFNKIQLKPVDKTQKIWSTEVEIKSIGIKKAIKRHGIFMKMDVLGGDLDEPVWCSLPFKVMP